MELFLRWRWLAALGCGLVAAGTGSAAEMPPEPAWVALARKMDGGLRRLEQEIAAAQSELAVLACIPKEQTGERLGYHSRIINDKTELWVQIDLQDVRRLDALVLAPVVLPQEQGGIAGYGFPRRFRVDLANDPSMTDAVTVLDASAQDYPNPGRTPVVVPCDGRQARYIRLTVITAGQIGVTLSSSLLALAEIMALQGDRNVAAGRPVNAPTSREAAPVWSLQNLTDGQSILGPPVGSAELPERGWHSVVFEDQDTVKEISITWDEPHTLDDVRLFPLRWKGYPHWVGFGFPLRFKIEAFLEDAEGQPVWIADHRDRDFPNPGLNPVTFPADGVRARRVKLTATRHWERFNDYACALGEIQIFAGGENIARQAQVQTGDTYPSKPWLAEYLVDGNTVNHPILPLDEWLRQLQRAGVLEGALANLQRAREMKLAQWSRALVMTGVGLLVLAFLFVGWLAVRASLRRRWELRLLRDRIARDLHDEVGSNLAGIALLGREGEKQAKGELAEILGEIRQAAEQTTGSMRDLVWMIQPGLPGDLPDGLRQVAARLLRGVKVEFKAPEQPLPAGLPPDFKRQIYLIFREALQNINKHSRASVVEASLQTKGRQLLMTIRDNGCGLKAGAAPQQGHGLANMMERARSLKGRCEVVDHPQGGCEVQVQVPLPC